MPIVTLKYNLPEENEEYRLATQGSSLQCVLFEFNEWLRQELKYNSEHYDNKEYKLLDTVQEKLWEFLKEHQVEI